MSMKKILYLLAILSIGATEVRAQEEWQGQLKPTVDPKPELPNRGQWPASRAAIVLEGGVVEQWPNGLGRASWDQGARLLSLDFSPENLAQSDLVRLSIVVLAKGPGLPAGNFGARPTNKTANLRNLAVGHLVANQTLYAVQSGTVSVRPAGNGVLQGAFDVWAVATRKAKGRVGPNDKPVRIRGQFAVLAP